MWRYIAQFVLKNRLLLLLLIFGITCFMGYKAKDVKMSYSYAMLLPEDDSVYIDNQDLIKLFGKQSDVVLAGVKDPDFFEKSHFDSWSQLSDDLNNIEGVEHVFSIASAYDIKKNSEIKQFEIVPLIGEGTQSQESLDSLYQRVEELPFYEGRLYNKDSTTYMMAVTVDSVMMGSQRRELLMSDIDEAFDKYQNSIGIDIAITGMPYVRVVTAKMIKKEFFLFICLALSVVVVILFAFFKAKKQVLLSLLVVAIGVIWSVGTMSIMGYEITLLTGMIPPLIIVIGVPNCIFLINKYHTEYLKCKDQEAALNIAVMKIGNATLLTNITTASGFAAFMVTSSDILKEFGFVAALNILGVFFISIMVIPTIFSYLQPPKIKDTNHLNRVFFNRLIGSLIKVTVSYRPYVYLFSVVLILLGVVGITKIKSTGYMVDDIPAESNIMQDLKFFERSFDGILPIEILVKTGKANGVTRNSMLKKLEKLSEECSKLEDLSVGTSIVPLMKFAKQSFYNGKPKYFDLPSSREQTFILSYISNEINVGEGGDDLLGQYIDANRETARISFRVNDVGTDKMDQIISQIEEIAVDIFPSDKYDVVITGSSVVFVKGTQYLVNSLFQSLGLAILLIAIFMAFMFKSWRMVFLSLISNIIPLIFTAAVMGFAGIPIKASTILVFSIAFGISVDDTIHFLAKYRQELNLTSRAIKDSVILALSETGISMIYTSIVLFFGFGIFSFSDFGGTIALGILISLTLFVALFSNLVLLPSLLIDLRKRVTTDNFSPTTSENNNTIEQPLYKE